MPSKTWEDSYQEVVKLLGDEVAWMYKDCKFVLSHNPKDSHYKGGWAIFRLVSPYDAGRISTWPTSYVAHAIIEKFLREHLDERGIRVRMIDNHYVAGMDGKLGFESLERLPDNGYGKLVQMTEKKMDSYAEALAQGLRILEYLK